MSWTLWKSMVIPRGVPNSSFRLYRLPIDAEESSTRLETPKERSLSDMCRRRGLKLSWVERGTSKTLVGATVGGNERTWFSSAKFIPQ